MPSLQCDWYVQGQLWTSPSPGTPLGPLFLKKIVDAPEEGHGLSLRGRFHAGDHPGY